MLSHLVEMSLKKNLSLHISDKVHKANSILITWYNQKKLEIFISIVFRYVI